MFVTILQSNTVPTRPKWENSLHAGHPPASGGLVIEMAQAFPRFAQGVLSHSQRKRS